MTLVEVAICLGLMSFALVSMLGLLPAGLSTLRDARDATAQGNYLQTLSAAYLSLGFTNMPASETYFFDQDGQQVEETAPTRHYRVSVEVQSPEYPGKPAGIEKSLRQLKVTSGQLDSSGTPVGPTRIHSLNIADGGF